MKKRIFSLLVILQFLILGITVTAQEAQKSVVILDTPEVITEMEKAQQLAGNDKYLLWTLRQMGNMDPDGKPLVTRSQTSNVNATPTKVFDNLYYIGGTRTGGWLLTTSEGYIMMDAMYGTSPEETLIPGMNELGLDPAKVKYIVITHPGPDHAGGAGYFQEKYGTQVIMDANAWELMENPGPDSWQMKLEKAREEGRPLNTQEKDWKGPPQKDIVGTDGQKLTLGDTTITMVFTPRTADGGGLSYIFPVFDNGEPHMMASYGNSGIPKSLEERKLYRESVQHFLTYTDAANVDVVLSSHPFVDGSVERMEELKNRKTDDPNPFVIGQDAARRYISLFDQCCSLLAARTKAGLDDTGTQRLEDMPQRGGEARP